MPRHDRPPDVPAHMDDSPLSVSFDQARCTRCGTVSSPPHEAVADFPLPDTDDPRGDRTCVDCAAAAYADRTPLDEANARVLALLVAGYDHAQISRAVGTSELDVQRTAKRLHREYGAGGTVGRLLEYL